MVISKPDTYLHGFDLTTATLPAELAKLLPGVDLTWLTDGLTGWQDGVGSVITQFAEWSDDLAPWYTPLTVGMDALIPDYLS